MHSALRITATSIALAVLTFGAAAKDTVRLAGTYTASSALPYFVAQKNGYFEAEDLEVTQVNVLTSPLGVQTVLSGDADGLANVVALEIANINGRRPGSITFFSMFGQNATYPMEQFIVSPDYPGDTLESLKGANLFVLAGPANTALAKAALAAVGLTADVDYKMSELPTNQHVGALAAKTFDGGYTVEPLATIAINQGVAKQIEAGVIATHVLGDKDAMAWGAGTGLANSFIEAKPDVARRFANAWRKAIADIEADAPGVRDLLVEHMNTPADVAAKLVILKAKMVKDMTEEEIAQFQAYVDFGVNSGLLQTPVKVTDFMAPLGD